MTLLFGMGSTYISGSPLLLLFAISFASGLLMLVVFRLTSNQKAIRLAKDQVQAQLLAVRLFQDQLSAVLRAYGRLLIGTGRYIRLMVVPTLVLLLVFAPLILFLDPYFGYVPLRAEEPFLFTLHLADPAALDAVNLQLPTEIAASAPPVHVPGSQEVVWRLVPQKSGTYPVTVVTSAGNFAEPVVVSGGVRHLSASRWRSGSWERWTQPADTALPAASPIEQLEVGYAPREIDLWLFQTNWIVVFFALSILVALVFKKAMGVEL